MQLAAGVSKVRTPAKITYYTTDGSKFTNAKKANHWQRRLTAESKVRKYLTDAGITTPSSGGTRLTTIKLVGLLLDPVHSREISKRLRGR